ncbi:zinc-dependent alcohol dehydrogenase family protein [Salinispira pacifica]
MVLGASADIEEKPLSLAEVERPSPGAGQILVEVAVCGVCHTDLHTVEGDLDVPSFPLIIGHQIVGRVAELGPEVSGWKRGDRVGIPWLWRSCGRCRQCLAGRENLCENPRFTGLHVDGGYAEYMVADAAFANRIPDEFDDVHAAPLLCAGIIGFRSLRLSGYRPGGTLALFGFGASAHIALQLAVADGSRVAVYSRSREHLDLAARLGAKWCGHTGEHPPFPVESAVTFAPVGRIVTDALNVVDRGGTVAINAVHMSPIPEIEYPRIYHERTIRSVANATREDASSFFEAAAAARVQTETTEFALEEANHALMRLKRSEVQGAAVLRIH